MKKFNLGSKVIVSDPCYEIPTWCQAVVDNVLPGRYLGSVNESATGGWGDRVHTLTAVHEDFNYHRLSWEKHPATIGVDSGQAGIFDAESYRNDEACPELPLIWAEDWGNKPGDKWYQRMCSLTLDSSDGGVDDEQYGAYDSGMVSSSGYGDGSYDLMVAKVDGHIVGFEIIFIGEDEEDED